MTGFYVIDMVGRSEVVEQVGDGINTPLNDNGKELAEGEWVA